MRAGPSGHRELRTATFPPSSSLNSTQSPWGLLCLLFFQAVTRRGLAGIPLVICDICDLSIKPSQPATRERAKHPERLDRATASVVVLAGVRDVEMEIASRAPALASACVR